jgi:hypothetical protein
MQHQDCISWKATPLVGGFAHGSNQRLSSAELITVDKLLTQVYLRHLLLMSSYPVLSTRVTLTSVPPGASVLASASAEGPATQLRPSLGAGSPAASGCCQRRKTNRQTSPFSVSAEQDASTTHAGEEGGRGGLMQVAADDFIDARAET